jgi:hypothetical protein
VTYFITVSLSIINGFHGKTIHGCQKYDTIIF